MKNHFIFILRFYVKGLTLCGLLFLLPALSSADPQVSCDCTYSCTFCPTTSTFSQWQLNALNCGMTEGFQCKSTVLTETEYQCNDLSSLRFGDNLDYYAGAPIYFSKWDVRECGRYCRPSDGDQSVPLCADVTISETADPAAGMQLKQGSAFPTRSIIGAFPVVNLPAVAAPPAFTQAQTDALNAATNPTTNPLLPLLVSSQRLLKTAETTAVDFGKMRLGSWSQNNFILTNTTTSQMTVTLTIPAGFSHVLPTPVKTGSGTLPVPSPSQSGTPPVISSVFSEPDATWLTRWTGVKTQTLVIPAKGQVTTPLFFGGTTLGEQTGTLVIKGSTATYNIPLTGAVSNTAARLEYAMSNAVSYVLLEPDTASSLYLGEIPTAGLKVYSFAIRNVGGTAVNLTLPTLPTGIRMPVPPNTTLAAGATANFNLEVKGSATVRKLELKFLPSGANTLRNSLYLSWGVL